MDQGKGMTMDQGKGMTMGQGKSMTMDQGNGMTKGQPSKHQTYLDVRECPILVRSKTDVHTMSW